MPLTPYLRPQDTITQILRNTTPPAVARRNPLVIGPQYFVQPNDGRALYKAAFSASAVADFGYRLADASLVDLLAMTPVVASVQMFGEGLEAKVNTAVLTLTREGTTDDTFRCATSLKGGTLTPALDGRAIRIGDVIEVLVAGVSTARRTVVALLLKAASTTEYDGVKLSGPVIGTGIFTANVFQPYTGKLDSTNVATGAAFTATTATVGYAAALGLPKSVTARTTTSISPFENAVGKVFFAYKAVVIPSATEGAIAITSAATMADLVGEPHLDNWLGRGVFEAFSGNQSQRVYALRTADDSVEAFTAALKKVRSTDIYYALAVMSDKLDVKQLVTAHCEEMSNKFIKNFRRCYVGTDSPGEYTQWAASRGVTAAVASQVMTIDTATRGLGEFTSADVGSVVYFNGVSTTRYTITAVYSAYECRLDIASGTAVATGSTVTLLRTDVADNVVRYVQEQATALSSRRCTNVWSDYPTYTGKSGTAIVPAKFIAAEIAGLRCALLPQQGLTMTEITSITAAPSMYTRFTPEQLDAIASYGNLVVTQEAEGGEIFIRHQLTTETAEGALAYEDNVGVIVDEFSYQVKDTFRSYIGKRNATANTVIEIRNKLIELATAATTIDIVNADIGPMVSRFFDEDGKENSATVRVDGVLADHLLTYVKLRVPLPLNGLDHYIDVETAVDL